MTAQTSLPSAAKPTQAKQAQQALFWILLAGSTLAMLSFGIRSSFGIFKLPMQLDSGYAPWVFAWSLSLQNLLWGVMQPVAGYFADRFGTWRVLVVGLLVYASGMVLMIFDQGPWLKFVSMGFLVGAGIAGTSFSLVMTAFVRLVSPQYRAMAAALGTAAGSLGQVVIIPLSTLFIAQLGWMNASLFLAALLLCSIPLTLALRERPKSQAEQEQEQKQAQASPQINAAQALKQAVSNRSYWLLMAGFFACGYLLAFCTVYLPQQIAREGLPSGYAALTLMLIGLFNIIGSLSVGALAVKRSNKRLLSLNYTIRALSVLAILTLSTPQISLLGLNIPPQGLLYILFGIVMGLMWLSTVPPTMNLVALMHGTKNLAMLYGWVFLSHQLGAFFGLMLAGWAETRFGSVQIMWWSCVAVNLFAAIIHWPIREQAFVPKQPIAA